MPSIHSKGAGIKKILYTRLLDKKASLIFLFSFIVFPGLAQTGFETPGETLRSPEEGIYNSQNITLLSSKFRADLKGPVGGPSDIVIEDDALVASVSPVTDVEAEKIVSAAERDISIYTVREGDSIGSIAEMFEISPNTLRWANDIEVKGTIKPGQELLILPIEGVKHKVKSGQTIEGIAKIYHGDAREIRIFNGIEDGEALAIGAEIIIPNGEMAATSTPAKKPASKGSASKEVAKGYYIRPIKGIKTQNGHGKYLGIDVGAGVGTPVWAMASGTVISAKSPSAWNGGYGGLVIISHANGTQTLYAHLSRIDVKQGQKVEQGQVIGGSGNTGRSTGPHLHFEIRGATSTAAKLY